jgi:hypothetical protein
MEAKDQAMVDATFFYFRGGEAILLSCELNCAQG